MCLAVPGKIIRHVGTDAQIDMQGNRLDVSTVLTPDVNVGDWVLVHAGFSIQVVSEDEAKETFAILDEIDQLSETK